MSEGPKVVNVYGDSFPPHFGQYLEFIENFAGKPKEISFSENFAIIRTDSMIPIKVRDPDLLGLLKFGLIKDLFIHGDLQLDERDADIIARREARHGLGKVLNRIMDYDLEKTIIDLRHVFLGDAIRSMRDYLRSEQKKKEDLVAKMLSIAYGNELTYGMAKDVYGPKKVSQLVRNHNYKELFNHLIYLRKLDRENGMVIGVRKGKIIGFEATDSSGSRIENESERYARRPSMYKRSVSTVW